MSLVPRHATARLPGTAQATGVAPVQDGAAILFTLPNDTRIYRRAALRRRGRR